MVPSCDGDSSQEDLEAAVTGARASWVRRTPPGVGAVALHVPCQQDTSPRPTPPWWCQRGLPLSTHPMCARVEATRDLFPRAGSSGDSARGRLGAGSRTLPCDNPRAQLLASCILFLHFEKVVTLAQVQSQTCNSFSLPPPPPALYTNLRRGAFSPFVGVGEQRDLILNSR